MTEREPVLAHIYGEVAAGRALDRVLSEDEGMPGSSTFWRWHMADEQIRDNLARARENGVERLMGECVDIADTQEVGEIRTVKADGAIEVKTEDMLGHRKLRIETRMKYAQMIAPRKYGAKLDVTSGGEAINLADAIAQRRAKVADVDAI